MDFNDQLLRAHCLGFCMEPDQKVRNYSLDSPLVKKDLQGSKLPHGHSSPLFVAFLYH